MGTQQETATRVIESLRAKMDAARTISPEAKRFAEAEMLGAIRLAHELGIKS